MESHAISKCSQVLNRYKSASFLHSELLQLFFQSCSCFACLRKKHLMAQLKHQYWYEHSLHVRNIPNVNLMSYLTKSTGYDWSEPHLPSWCAEISLNCITCVNCANRITCITCITCIKCVNCCSCCNCAHCSSCHYCSACDSWSVGVHAQEKA